MLPVTPRTIHLWVFKDQGPLSPVSSPQSSQKSEPTAQRLWARLSEAKKKGKGRRFGFGQACLNSGSQGPSPDLPKEALEVGPRHLHVNKLPVWHIPSIVAVYL